ncbi:pyrroline-5-carboxylate reductase family protein [Aspergillus brunneoviolaceus CBS 621.78]|uniref:Pyrroline-5-carboxylate reductase n=1 Tax=Aspergillus brunneoviolaceus CBS 621.78 TaxID=1450534 RepID=A0ACD1GDQ4_9EURO|nr:pyrroline-5-carboxylate reductase [Aspergillus brunneoviolaceus CBS 621.78]RAH47393.1 pyrroline-5-carboxylate reductase [Aspergillus brunneoviolaceus CBS 621.78]
MIHKIPRNSGYPSPRITIAGCGVLGKGIATGLIASPLNLDPSKITLTVRREQHAHYLREEFPGLAITLDNGDPALWQGETTDDEEGHFLFIVTKPQHVQLVCADIYPHIQASRTPPVVITLCPGITIAQLQGWLPTGTPIVRSMPNTPVMVCQGATGLFPSSLVTPCQLITLTRMFEAISPSVVTLAHEDQLNVVAAISGSAPAYFYRLMDSMVATGVSLGLPESLARDLITQSCIGSGAFAREIPSVSLAQLKNDVCVPGGSTEKAMDVLDAHGWHRGVKEAITASLTANRSMGQKVKEDS